MYLCGGAGGETQTSRKCCSEDKATDFEATDDFHDESFSVFSTKGGTARLSKSNTPALRIDQGFELSRGTKCRMSTYAYKVKGGLLVSPVDSMPAAVHLEQVFVNCASTSFRPLRLTAEEHLDQP